MPGLHRGRVRAQRHKRALARKSSRPRGRGSKERDQLVAFAGSPFSPRGQGYWGLSAQSGNRSAVRACAGTIVVGVNWCTVHQMMFSPYRAVLSRRRGRPPPTMDCLPAPIATGSRMRARRDERSAAVGARLPRSCRCPALPAARNRAIVLAAPTTHQRVAAVRREPGAADNARPPVARGLVPRGRLERPAGHVVVHGASQIEVVLIVPQP